ARCVRVSAPPRSSLFPYPPLFRSRLDAWEDGALSPMYVVFQVCDELDPDFFGHWLRSAEARQRIALAAQGSVRETVSFSDLGSIDRKSTRLNSSHVKSSYAVFCLK